MQLKGLIILLAFVGTTCAILSQQVAGESDKLPNDYTQIFDCMIGFSSSSFCDECCKDAGFNRGQLRGIANNCYCI